MAVKEREQHKARSGGSPSVVPGEQQQQRRRNLLKNLILRCSKLQAWELELFLSSSSRFWLEARS